MKTIRILKQAGGPMNRLSLLAAAWLAATPLAAQTLVEPPSLAGQVSKGELRPIAERLPKTPVVVDPAAGGGGSVGQHGGQIVTLVPRARDIRYISAHSYTRLVGYD